MKIQEMVCLSSELVMYIPTSMYLLYCNIISFCSFSGMGGTPPSVSGRQANSYARGRSTATTSTYQVSYLGNTKFLNYSTVFLLSSVLY